MDDKDLKILELLKQNSRISYTDLAKEVDLSRVAVKNRVQQLEKDGIILGYSVYLADESKTGIHFLMDVEIEPDHFEEVVNILCHESCNRHISRITGECRVHIDGNIATPELLDNYANRVFKEIKGVKRVVWNVVLATYK